MDRTGRTTVYNNITSELKLRDVNPDNIQLGNDFLEYLESIDRASSTIRQYKNNLNIFWCWNLEYNKDKFFVDLTKREIAKFQNHAINEWGWSPKRVRTVKATLSSLSNFISAILDDEYENYRPIINKIESPANETVREKAIFTEEDIKPALDKLVELEQYEKACLFALAFYGGRRKAELTRFKVHYFDDENLICGGALYKTPEKMKTKGRGQRGKMLDIYTLAKPFKPYFDLWMKQREELGIESEWLFPAANDIGEHIEVSTIDSWTRSFERIIGKPIYMHSLRHAYVTMLLGQNLPESVVQTILGWGSADMVGIYDDRSADQQLEKFFGAEGIKKVEKKGLEDL